MHVMYILDKPRCTTKNTRFAQGTINNTKYTQTYKYVYAKQIHIYKDTNGGSLRPACRSVVRPELAISLAEQHGVHGALHLVVAEAEQRQAQRQPGRRQLVDLARGHHQCEARGAHLVELTLPAAHPVRLGLGHL